MEDKLLRLFAVLVLCTGPGVGAQPYEPLLETENEWHLTTCFFGCVTDLYYTDGDTLVDGTEFKILDGYHYISRKFLLREELSSRKVYLKTILPSGIRDYLLYDFSLEVGDSIDMKNPVTPFPEDAGYYMLDSIVPRILEDGNAYRHFYLSPTPANTVSSTPAVWIEGVGSLSMINAPGGYPDINQVGHLSCAFKDGQSVYVNLDSIDGCAPQILKVDPVRTAMAGVRLIQGVEARDYQLINAARVRFIDLFTLDGKRVETILNPGDDQLRLQLGSYPSGVYLLVVRDNRNNKRVFRALIR